MFEFLIAFLLDLMVNTPAFWIALGIKQPNNAILWVLVITFYVIAYVVWRRRKNDD